MILTRRGQEGFALPTVLIVSVLLFTVLTASISVINSVNRTLDTQMYNRFVSEASESGLAMAQSCLETNNYTATWNDARPLRPWTDCAGNPVDCPSGGNCYVLNNGNIKTSFTIKAPVSDSSGNGVQTVNVDATLNLNRLSSNTTYRTMTATSKSKVGGVAAAQDIAFGYEVNGAGGGDPYGGSSTDPHAFFLTIAGDGKLRGVGFNGHGELGNGTFNNTSVPQEAVFPAGVVPVKTFVFMKSGDAMTYVLGSDGSMYTTGANGSGVTGQYGNSSTRINTFGKYVLPASDNKVKSGLGGASGLVLTTQNNIYSADTGCTPYAGVTGCPPPQPRRVELPAVTSDQNTVPTDNIVADGDVLFVRMAGGAVYGWGANTCGNLGQNDFTARSKPVRIPGFGDPGQPKAQQIDTSGGGLYIRDDAGAMWSLGCNGYGELGSQGNVLRSVISPSGTDRCMDIQWGASANGTPTWLWDCTSGDAQQWAFEASGAIRNIARNKCLDADVATGNVVVGSKVQLWDCNGSSQQQWDIDANGEFHNRRDSSKCIQVSGANGNNGASQTQLEMGQCNGTYAPQKWTFRSQPFPMKMNLPAGAKAVDFSTDFSSVSIAVDTNSDNNADDVLSVGLNHKGQFGDNSPQKIQPRLVRFQLPSGVKPIAKLNSSGTLVNTGQLEYPFANVFVIGTDNCVYGAGGNATGQLGIDNTIDSAVPRKMGPTATQMPCDAKVIKAGGGTTAVITNGGYVYTMGDNRYGQVGSEKYPPGPGSIVTTPQLGRYTNPQRPITY